MANMSSIRFFSLEPLQLDLIANEEDSSDGSSQCLSKRLAQMHELDFTNQFCTSPAKQSFILEQISKSQTPPFAIATVQKPGRTRPRSTSIAAAAAASQSLTTTIARICNIQTYIWRDTCLKDISASVQQVDVRNEQARLLPLQYRLIMARLQENLPSAAAQYISFYNCIWLILNDIIVGYAFGVFLRENSVVLGHLLSAYTERLTVDLVRQSLVWMDNWPVGLKLDTELSRFLCLSYLGITDTWHAILTGASPYFPSLLYVLGCLWPLGLSMMLSLTSDLLSVVTTSLYASYLIGCCIFRVQLMAIGSLWRLFRGKRRNILQNRTDSWDYDMDQLLLGTILFTLLIFLFPTVGIYYLLFALIRLIVIIAHATLETALTFMNHFPLFAVMLRLKDPSRLPGGVYVVLEGDPPRTVIKNSPIPLKRIFYQHLRVWSNLTAHYSPIRLLRCLLTGTFITPIERYSIRYDATRASGPRGT